MSQSSPLWKCFAAAFHASLSPQSLSFSFLGVSVMLVGWWIAGSISLQPTTESSPDVEVAAARHYEVLTSFFGSKSSLPAPLDDWRVKVAEQLGEPAPIDPIHGVVSRLVDPVRRLFVVGNSWRTFFFYLIGGLISLASWSFFGTAITRAAVLRCVEATEGSALASVPHRNTKITFRATLQFARRKTFEVFSAVTLPLVGISLMALPLVGSGWLMRFDFGALIVGIGWAFVSLIGLLMGVLGIGLMAGWPLMWGTICTEGSDAFDAISRSYAYTFQRPLHYLVYALLAFVLSLLGWLVAWCLGAMVVNFSLWSVEWGCGAERMSELLALIQQPSRPPNVDSSAWFGAKAIEATTTGVRCLTSAYFYSFFWSIAGAIYLLLRHETDQTDFSEIYADDTNEANVDAG